MKRFLMQLGTLMIGGVLIAGCQADEENSMSNNQSEAPEAVETMKQQGENSDLSNTALVKGLDTVLLTVNQLKETISISPKDVKQVNALGKALEENWDKIEKAVEKRNPEAYENIEESLYPLIAEAKKATPEIEKIKTLIDDTTKKLNDYKEKIQ